MGELADGSQWSQIPVPPEGSSETIFIFLLPTGVFHPNPNVVLHSSWRRFVTTHRDLHRDYPSPGLEKVCSRFALLR
jgi:hypothetical protein